MAVQGVRIEALAERMIARACRRLPDELRAEQIAEWSAELPAILSDPSRRFYIHRAWTTLRFAQGQFLSARRMTPRAARFRVRRSATARLWALVRHNAEPKRILTGGALVVSTMMIFLLLWQMFTAQGEKLVVAVGSTLGMSLFSGIRAWWRSRSRRRAARESVAE